MVAVSGVEITTIVFFILSSVLSIYLTSSYFDRRQKQYLYWGIGMWIFAITDLLEVLFAWGVYSTGIAQAYLFLVALLVVPLAMGSISLIKSRLAIRAYVAYSAVVSAALLYYVITSNIGSIVTNGIVNGQMPVPVLAVSSLITFPGLIIIVGIAVLSYVRTKRRKVLWIIAGMLVFALGGMLYIASIPASIYYTEFAGLLMLWLGFFDFSRMRKRR